MVKAYNLPIPSELFDPAVYSLGKPCKRNHLWDDRFTLRLIKGRKCPICDRIDSRKRQARLREDPEYRAKQAAWIKDKRKHEGRPYRGKHLTEWHEQRRLKSAINRAGKLLTVLQLVQAEQRRYWQEHPEKYKEFARIQARERARWRQAVDPDYRLYHRQKSKRRKAVMRESVGIQLKGEQIRRRFAEFDHCCAYCGVAGDLHIEHVVPISKGGTHALGNVIPACQRCNFSKAANYVEAWYQAQPFFDQRRWRKIQHVLGWASRRQSIGQLALL
jgi:5-methylcytosine-specific restriction endonuclease McrA